MICRKMPHKNPWGVRILCLLMAGLTACSTTRPQYAWTDRGALGRREAPKTPPVLETWGTATDPSNTSDPMIAPGFLLSLSSLTDRKLNGDYRVDFDGNLALPYEINVNTNGYNLSELRKKLAALYHPFFKSPVDAELRVQERLYWVDVRGLVKTPGRYLVPPTASLDQVIGMAGGADKETPPQFARIQKGPKVFVLDLTEYFSQGEDHTQILGWLGGEVLFLQKDYTSALGDRLPSAPALLPIYMLGEVRKPGEYALRPGAEFADTLAAANGFTDLADLDRIEIVRRSGGRKRSYEFSWNEFERAPTPAPGDMVIVHAIQHGKSELRLQIAAIVVSILSSAAIIYELNRSNNINAR
jgi:protein involved in polysaccharide export with SLBB domain